MNSAARAPTTLGGAAVSPTADDASVRGLYRSLLRALLERLAVQPAVIAQVLESEACVVSGVAMEFRLDERARTVEMFFDLGEPEGLPAAVFYRRLLEIQLKQGVSPFWVLGADPVSGRGVLASTYILTEAEGDCSDFLLFLQAYVNVAKTLRAALQQATKQ